MTRLVCFFVFPQFQLLDLSGPLAAFQIASDAAPGSYDLRVVAQAAGPVASSSALAVVARPLGRTTPDTFVVVGGRGVHQCVDTKRTRALVARWAAAARRTASVCTGAFLLAAAGVLDGRRATTHWRMAARLQQDYPAVDVAPDRIFVTDGPVWTSAGITAGIDLALALIEDDLGADIAKAVAQEMVVYYRRPTGQSQFSALLDLQPSSDRIGRTLDYARRHLAEDLTIDRLAAVACMSPRQFARVFCAETGCTPAKAIERLRVETARPMIEAASQGFAAVARQVGFQDPDRMRKAFLRVYGQPPQALRRGAARA